jgi:hypothetical protein
MLIISAVSFISKKNALVLEGINAIFVELVCLADGARWWREVFTASDFFYSQKLAR